jgi:hypothetical protein
MSMRGRHAVWPARVRRRTKVVAAALHFGPGGRRICRLDADAFGGSAAHLFRENPKER